MVSTGIDVKNHFLISTNSIVLAFKVSYIFQVAGIAMMLAISLLRYRATVHPLKPANTPHCSLTL